jgi:gentisate 1,2-dioxygenase
MLSSAASVVPERAEFYERLRPHSLAPLWEVLHGLVTPQPTSRIAPAHWRYDEVRPFIMEAGRLITAKEAERRVIVLENPALPGQSAVTRSLYAGLQLILPGEVARAHRHTQSALRFVLEGEGAYTAVGGERRSMRYGDFIITPAWSWHDHGNETDEPMVWLDGLDIPLVSFFEASFAEPGNAEQQMVTKPEGDSLARFGAGLLPVDWKKESPTSPIFVYPYDRTREALEQMKRAEAWDPCHGLKLRYVDPTTGGYAMPTIATFIQLLPRGFETAPYRSTDGTVYVAVEGEGETRVGDAVFRWRPRDVFVVPSWMAHRHKAAAESVLFSFSDRVVQEKLGLWREDRGAA